MNMKLPKEFEEYKADIQNYAQMILNGVWYNFILKNSSTSTFHWVDKINDATLSNQVLTLLAFHKLVRCEVQSGRNWSELTMHPDVYKAIDVDELRKESKVTHYLPHKQEGRPLAKTTKIGNELFNTGLKRPGFQYSAETPYSFDVEMMTKYRDIIINNANLNMLDTMKKYPHLIEDVANYKVTTNSVINEIILADDEYYLGDVTNDSRGRVNYKTASKIFNVIGYKDARAVIKYDPVSITGKKLSHIFKFIGELTGSKEMGTLREIDGISAYFNRVEIELDFNDPKDCKELHEKMWLERLYIQLDALFSADACDDDTANNAFLRLITRTKLEAVANGTGSTQIELYQDMRSFVSEYKVMFHNVTVPCEKDATASMIMIIGALLGHNQYLTETNCAGNTRDDAWTIPDVTREQVKKSLTPILYGSSASVTKLLRKAQIDATDDELNILHRELTQGKFALAVRFKDFIFNNCQTKPFMKLHVDEEQFIVKCNRHEVTGDYVTEYRLVDTMGKKPVVKRVRHTTVKEVPNLRAFVRFMMTGLIHNLDSQISEKICLAVGTNGSSSIISVHDAWVHSPIDGDIVEGAFTEAIDHIYQNRAKILENYFNSIGINMNKATVRREWEKVLQMIDPIKDFKCSTNCLK